MRKLGLVKCVRCGRLKCYTLRKSRRHKRHVRQFSKMMK